MPRYLACFFPRLDILIIEGKIFLLPSSDPKQPLSERLFCFRKGERPCPEPRSSAIATRANCRLWWIVLPQPPGLGNPRLGSPARPGSTLVSYRSTVGTFDSNRCAAHVFSPGPIHLKPKWMSANHPRIRCLHRPRKSPALWIQMLATQQPPSARPPRTPFRAQRLKPRMRESEDARHARRAWRI